MKRKLILTICAFVLAITGAVATKADAKFAVFFIDSGDPGACDSGGTLPPGCGSMNTGTLCRVTSGTTLTYYQNSTCTIPWYRQQ